MKLLVFGKNGQLGLELQKTLPETGDVFAYSKDECNVADANAVRDVIHNIQPDVIINASAYTKVDQAETDISSARAINATAPGIMADAAKQIKSAFIHISTDYVFDGSKGAPYIESDSTNPLNMYGQSKLEGETAIQQVGGAYAIFRTSWVYSLNGDSFITKVLAWARKNETLKIVSDQIGSPSSAQMLAEILTKLILQSAESPVDYFSENQGVYHLAGKGYTSRLDWAKKILELDPKRDEQIVKSIEPAQTSDFPTPAIRPLFSALDCGKFERVFGYSIPEWQISLKTALQ